MTAYEAIAVTPIAGALGAELGGVDLAAPLGDETYAEIRRAMVEHLVIFFRDQRLTPEQQIALTARFGAVSRVPFVEPMCGHPDIIAVLKEADEVGISTGGSRVAAWVIPTNEELMIARHTRVLVGLGEGPA